MAPSPSVERSVVDSDERKAARREKKRQRKLLAADEKKPEEDPEAAPHKTPRAEHGGSDEAKAAKRARKEARKRKRALEEARDEPTDTGGKALASRPRVREVEATEPGDALDSGELDSGADGALDEPGEATGEVALVQLGWRERCAFGSSNPRPRPFPFPWPSPRTWPARPAPSPRTLSLSRRTFWKDVAAEVNTQLSDVRGPRPRPQIKEKVYTIALSRKGTAGDSATRGKLGRPSTFTKEESDRLFDMRDRQGASWHAIGDELGRYYRHCWDHYYTRHEHKKMGTPACDVVCTCGRPTRVGARVGASA